MTDQQRDPAVARAIAAATRRPDADLSDCNSDELLASALYAEQVAAALTTAKVALWSELAYRGWSYQRLADETGASRSTVHDAVAAYRRRS